MSLSESMVDINVAGDGSYEGLTYETDQERLEYIKDVFDGSSDTVSRWKILPSNVVKLDINGAEGRMFDLDEAHRRSCFDVVFSSRPEKSRRNE
jgi:hypothetical protein